MHPVRLSEAATEELDEAYRWHESQREGLGEELLAKFLRTLELVEENPRLYPFVEGETHRALINRFPYGLFYRLGNDGVSVIAFFHGSRDPMRWKRR